MSNLEVVAWMRGNPQGWMGKYGPEQAFPDDDLLVRQSDALAVIAEFAHDLRATERTVIEQGELLQSVVRAIRGDPAYGCSHSVHDAPELALSAMHRITELEAENARLRERLTLIMCEPINAEYIAQAALDMVIKQPKIDTLPERVQKSAESIHIDDQSEIGGSGICQHHAIDWPEDDSRIDIVGQNGNTAEHYEVKS